MSEASTGVERRPAPKWTIGDRIRLVRRDMRLSQAEFAARLGIGVKALGAWESGYNAPANIAAVAVDLEQITGVDRMWFVGWGDPLAAEPRTASESAWSLITAGQGLTVPDRRLTIVASDGVALHLAGAA